jgi:hypothetical protein
MLRARVSCRRSITRGSPTAAWLVIDFDEHAAAEMMNPSLIGQPVAEQCAGLEQNPAHRVEGCR